MLRCVPARRLPLSAAFLTDPLVLRTFALFNNDACIAPSPCAQIRQSTRDIQADYGRDIGCASTIPLAQMRNHLLAAIQFP